MYVTQKEIADRLGVSRQMVTYALSGGGTVAPQKRREIIEVAEKMGYRRNELARAMVTGKSRILGILSTAEINENIGRTIAGALEEATRNDYSTKLMFLPFDADEIEAQHIVKRCSAWRLDGCLATNLSDRHIEILRHEMTQSNRPIVFAGNSPPECAIGVCTDDDSAWRLAVQHLVDLGHRRIAHLGALSTSKLAVTRLESCQKVLQEFGLAVDDFSTTFTSWADAALIEQGVHRLLNAPQPPSALLCAGDVLGLIALRVARRRGLKVPEQLSIIGFGDNSESKLSDPALTSIAQPHEEVARVAVRRLLAHVECGPEDIAPTKKLQRLTFGCRLILRDSTGPHRKINCCFSAFH